jgi:hypothetical protein
MVQLILGVVIVFRAKPRDLPRIAESFGKWFTRRNR